MPTGIQFQKFDSFVKNIANKKYNLGSDTLTIALTDVSPVTAGVSTVGQISEITQISYTNLPTSRVVVQASSTQVAGLYTLMCNILDLISTSGLVAQFRYAVLYDATATGFELVGWYDFAQEIILNGATSDHLVLNFDQTNGVLTLQ